MAMAKSMTGYGRVVQQMDDLTIMVEMRSINHRFLDISIKAPHSILFIEDKLKKFIHEKFNRGRIELFIKIEGQKFAKRNLVADWQLLDQYIDLIDTIKDKYNLSGEIPISNLLSLPDLVVVEETTADDDEVIDLLFSSVNQVCEQVLATRKTEGNYIIEDLAARLKNVQQTVVEIDQLQPQVIAAYQKRIMTRIEEYISGDVIDENRLHQEIAYLIERGDITEEITRLKAHSEHFLTVIEKGSPMGRELDFLVQEMHREINTIGSKAIDSQLSEKAIYLKSEVEKIREQVQNIE